MQFNKCRFNKGRFNTLDNLTVIIDANLLAKGDVASNSVRIAIIDETFLYGQADIDSNIHRTTYTKTTLNGAAEIIIDKAIKIRFINGEFDGESIIYSKGIREIPVCTNFDGTVTIIAIAEIDGIITIEVNITNKGNIKAIPTAIYSTSTMLSGYTDISTNVKRYTSIIAEFVSKGNIIPNAIAIKRAKGIYTGESDINIDAIKILLSLAEIKGYSDISVSLSKMFYGEILIKNKGDLSAIGKNIAMPFIIITGESNISVTPYFIYKPPYIILPTKALIEDTGTKVVIIW